jgi:hypothetical protein
MEIKREHRCLAFADSWKRTDSREKERYRNSKQIGGIATDQAKDELD